jgi:hypothetical protein
MIGDKTLQFQGKGVDLDHLRQQIVGFLEADRFGVQSSATGDHGFVIQARKGGFLAGLVAADRAMTITGSGAAEDATVHIGIGKWIEHLAVTAVETLLLSDLFLVVDVAETAWNVEIEDKLVHQIEAAVG